MSGNHPNRGRRVISLALTPRQYRLMRKALNQHPAWASPMQVAKEAARLRILEGRLSQAWERASTPTPKR